MRRFSCWRGRRGGDGAFGVVGGGFVDPVEPLGRVEPAVAEVDEAAGGLGDGDGARVVGIAGGGSVGRQDVGECEDLEGGGGRVAWAVFKAGARAQRPGFVEAAVEDAERGVVVGCIGEEWLQTPSFAASQSRNSRGPRILTLWYPPRLRSWRSPVTRCIAPPVTAVARIRSSSGVVAMPRTSANSGTTRAPSRIKFSARTAPTGPRR